MNADVWTSPADIVAQLERLWKQGRLLASDLTFPLKLRLRRPSPKDLTENFEAVRNWIRFLEEGSRAKTGAGYDIGWTAINNRQFGRNRLPSSISVEAREDALAMIGRREEAARFAVLKQATTTAFPELAVWLEHKPLTAIAHAESWDQILDVLHWFRTQQRPGSYLRQLDIVGVDTKFIEGRRGLLTELLEVVAPPLSGDELTVSKNIETKFGLRTKPKLVRFRMLDPVKAAGSWTDLTVPLSEFASLPVDAQHVFVTENEITGISFPPCEDSIVIFGAGYAVDKLSVVPWLLDRNVHYWGDIDTHGFVILAMLRAIFPKVKSLLMDRETLLAHRELWSVEEVPFIADLEGLSTEESTLFDDLRRARLGRGVRLEQERVSFGMLIKALRKITS